MDLSKRKILVKTFVVSQCNYCPLVWMFHSRKLNNRINSIYECALRISYKDCKSSFNELEKITQLQFIKGIYKLLQQKSLK